MESEPTIINRRKPHLWWNQPWTLVEGCTRCSPGCRDCWALAMEKRTGRAVTGGYDVRQREDRLDHPLHWRKPRVVFVLNDLFHEQVNHSMFRLGAMTTIARTPQHTYLILTKRADHLRKVIGQCRPPRNAWLGVTCESNAHLDRVAALVRTPAAVRWVNAHLLGPLDLSVALPSEYWCLCGYKGNTTGTDYCQDCGEEFAPPPGDTCLHCESNIYDSSCPECGSVEKFGHWSTGPLEDRPATIDWLAIECNRPFRGDPREWWGWCRALVAQAVAAGVPVWVKQGPLLTGAVTHNIEDFPPFAQRREFPKEGESDG